MASYEQHKEQNSRRNDNSNACSLGDIKGNASFSNIHGMKKRGNSFASDSKYQMMEDFSKNKKIKPVIGDYSQSTRPVQKQKSYTPHSHLPFQKRPNFVSLRDLIEKNPNEILLNILDKRSGILSSLHGNNINKDLMAYILIALGKSCSSHMHRNINNLIKIVCENSKNILVNIQRYLVSIQNLETSEKFHLESLFYLVVFLEIFQSVLPSSSSELISVLLPLLDSTCVRCLKPNEDLYCNATQKIREIEKQNQNFLNQHSLVEVKRRSEKDKLHLLEPPESFRSLSVLPTTDDVNLPCTFLHPNIVEGKYRDTEHYLDVQFRLLKEDYIKPLRDGIAEYLSLKKVGKPHKNTQNVRVYSNVHIVHAEFFNGDLFHILQFSNKEFINIKWEHSKRFITGSLLCLSSDDFQTMLFASVVYRDPKELKKGLLRIQFEDVTEEILNLSHIVDYVIIESTAYFESYRHTLKVLHQLNEEVLPLKAYIIDVEKIVGKPFYLSPETIYDIRPLLVPMDEKYNFEKTLLKKYEYPPDINNSFESTKVMNEDCWPKASDLNLDHSQYLALRAAITKEFAIIQGPPGTGKTYIGLRIVQLLLHNLSNWYSDEVNSLPILIVCYTNHALDQFLEGIKLFTNKIARIGGRGSNEAVFEFQLNILKRFVSDNRSFPSYMHNNIQQKNQELKELKSEIDKIKQKIEFSTKTVFSESELKIHIPPIQYDSLLNYDFAYGYEMYRYTVYDWLEISLSAARSVYQDNLKNHFQNLIDISNETNEDIESEEEADIEFIENERNIDFYEFSEDLFAEDSEPNNEFVELEDSDWIMVEDKKQKFEMVKHIKYCLKQSEVMTEETALKVKRVWDLNIHDRWMLYKFWLQKFIEEKKDELFGLQKQLKKKYEELHEMRCEEDLYVLKGSHVVGMTTTGAAKYRHLVQRLNHKVLIVEEAAEILESHIITSLASNTQHVILIGDQQQLRPSPSVYMLAVKYGMDISLFERMIKNGIDYNKLSIQHRMRPEIATLIVPHIYPNLKNHQLVTEFENIKGVKKNVYFISHNVKELQENDSKSKVNEHEARFLIKLCRYLIKQGYEPSQITILTTYSGQLFVLKGLATDDEVKNVRISVVDNFQGEENEIILISFVRSNDEGAIGFLKISNRVCVALSRAKKGLYCIGNFELFAEKSDLWKNIIGTLTQNQSIGPYLQLVCQNHSDMCNEVSEEIDFEAVSNGGCTRNCEYRLFCGHVCPMLCHPYDQDHELITCMKPCAKFCPEGHGCKKQCFETCDSSCKVIVNKTLKQCGHTVQDQCGNPEERIKCSFKCKKILHCTHECEKKCSEICESSCKKPCIKNCEKGHPCENKCFERCFCKFLIDKTLETCGHTVKTHCGQREQDIKCSFDCKKVLLCTHICGKKCGEFCETLCKQPCLKTCKDGHPCRKKCFEVCLCSVLVEKVLASCGHVVKVPCGKEVEFIECPFTCKKVLPCSHNCSNKCGEPCVTKCMQFVKIQSPLCGHALKVECYIANSSEKLFQKCLEKVKSCSEPCKKVLSCGHICKGTCGKCAQERLHIVCNEKCERILICGHMCESKCSKSCPPCRKPCERKCIHRKCNKKCSEPCIRCKEPCVWSCSHKKCTKSCSEICDRLACDEPCPKILLCSHQCCGFCGEPCPQDCRVCNKEKDNSFELKDEVWARYVLLEDCNHSFEFLALNEWMVTNSRENKNIQMKTCPLCKTVIRKNFRYGKIVKNTIIRIEAVKLKIKRDGDRTLELQKILLQKLRELCLCYTPSTKFMFKFLSSSSSKDIQQLTTIENMITIATDLKVLEFKTYSKFRLKQDLRELFQYGWTTEEWLDTFIQKHFIVSENQLLQLVLEVHRLKMIDKLLKYGYKNQKLDINCPEFAKCVGYVLTYTPFSRENMKDFLAAFENLTTKFGDSSGDISTTIKLPILKAMDMSIGHWFECPIRHICCVTECNESIQKGCYECIDKTSDRLLSDSFEALNSGIKKFNLQSQNQYHSVGATAYGSQHRGRGSRPHRSRGHPNDFRRNSSNYYRKF